MAITDLLQALKEECLSSGFSPDGILISAPAVPHCGDINTTADAHKLFFLQEHGTFYFAFTLFLIHDLE